jgi:hypothetical protein
VQVEATVEATASATLVPRRVQLDTLTISLVLSFPSHSLVRTLPYTTTSLIPCMNFHSRSSRRNMPFLPPHSAPTPNPGQKVYIVDCATCGSFLSSRGMKASLLFVISFNFLCQLTSDQAVLLLRPHIALYSTDALPVNCSAHATCSTSKARSTEASNQRTCSCLTQTLLCHGCGNPVGYMIVIPVCLFLLCLPPLGLTGLTQCEMCTSSSSADNRTTNNHRFVFHCGVVRAYERLFRSQEPYCLDVLPQPQDGMDHHSNPLQPNLLSIVSPRDLNLQPRIHLPTPPPDDLQPVTQPAISTPSLGVQNPATSEQQISSPIVVRIPSNTSPIHNDYFSRLFSEAGVLKAGDVVYWHHLARNGEIPACCDHISTRGMPA